MLGRGELPVNRFVLRAQVHDSLQPQSELRRVGLLSKFIMRVHGHRSTVPVSSKVAAQCGKKA
jgi:hypothetical protein